MTYNYTDETIQTVRQLYKEGKSSHEILTELKLPVTVRTIQRWIHDAGISRTVGDAFRLAVNKGRVKWHLKQIKKHRVKISPKLRYVIMTRDNFTCVKCGRQAPKCILEIDHINSKPDDNRAENLQTMCHDCNRGKYLTE